MWDKFEASWERKEKKGVSVCVCPHVSVPVCMRTRERREKYGWIARGGGKAGSWKEKRGSERIGEEESKEGYRVKMFTKNQFFFQISVAKVSLFLLRKTPIFFSILRVPVGI